MLRAGGVATASPEHEELVSVSDLHLRVRNGQRGGGPGRGVAGAASWQPCGGEGTRTLAPQGSRAKHFLL